MTSPTELVGLRKWLGIAVGRPTGSLGEPIVFNDSLGRRSARGRQLRVAAVERAENGERMGVDRGGGSQAADAGSGTVAPEPGAGLRDAAGAGLGALGLVDVAEVLALVGRRLIAERLEHAGRVDGLSNVFGQLGRRPLGVASRSSAAPGHLHVDVASTKLVEHLGEASLPGVLAFGPNDPTKVVVALIGRPRVVGFPEAVLDEGVADEVRHRVSWAASGIGHGASSASVNVSRQTRL